MTQSWKIYDFHIPIADFRKENGVVYVKTYPDWKDDETGQPFPEGTELIYADMNVEEGDIFPTFSLSGYTRVIREDKKVKAITSALLPDNQIRDTLVFSDDDSKIDILERYLDGMRYIDGIGFIKVNCFGHLDFYTGQLNNVYDSEGNVIVKGMNRKIPDYVKVNEVGVGNAPDVIYTIEGLRVNRSLSDLPAGLYIVNGKKVAVTR